MKALKARGEKPLYSMIPIGTKQVTQKITQDFCEFMKNR